MRDGDLNKLKNLSDMILDNQLGLLRKTAQEKSRSEAALVQLEQPSLASKDFAGVSANLADLSYQRWADVRRAEINVILAQQTHDWMKAREHARIAFGKAEALRKLSEKLGERRR